MQSARQHLGKVALITGASRGIGKAIAERLVAEGAHVVLTSLDTQVGEKVARALRRDAAADQHIVHLKCDVRSRPAVTAAVSRCVKEFGALDFAVANAGVSLTAEFLELTDEAWDQVLSTNLTGTFLTIQSAARAMTELGRPGRLVAVASTNAFWMETNLAAYNASKAAIVALCRTAAMELAPMGIKVNAVAPGLITTQMNRDVWEGGGHRRQRYLAQIPLGVFGGPSDVAGAVSFLLSDDAGWITGELLVVDGGQTLGTPYEAERADAPRSGD